MGIGTLHYRGAKLLETWRGTRLQQDVADLIGIDLARYNAWEQNRARPGLDWAIKIETVTKGDVPAKTWADDPIAKHKARAALARKAG